MTNRYDTRNGDKLKPEELPLAGRLIAFDLGAVRVGVAVSDPSQIIASPIETLQVPRDEDRPLVDALVNAIERHEAVGVVLGHPRRLDGHDGTAGSRARRVRDLLLERVELPVVLFDERFTTVEAERVLLDADLSRKKRRDTVDRVAAGVILQTALEAQRRLRPVSASSPEPDRIVS